MHKLSLAIVLTLIGLGAFLVFTKNELTSENSPTALEMKKETDVPRTEFSSFSSKYRFSAKIPSGLKAEYISNIQSINLYDPASKEGGSLGQSKIFIRFFEADSFLTLPSVNVLSRESTEINGHSAVRYEIEKKPTELGFPYQPPWRNHKHKLIDIRFAQTNPSLFYVFAYSPKYSKDEFDEFISSIVFHNDLKSLVSPITKAEERVTKKPFGIFITSENSPVDPEKFNGYHTGTDFEVLSGEENIEVSIATLCGGPLKTKRAASGYGGLAIQDCVLENQPVTVVYGHLRLSSITAPQNRYLPPGTKIGVLGRGNSAETDGERKHLHLGIHKGIELNIAGYVSKKEDLSSWLDPMTFLR